MTYTPPTGACAALELSRQGTLRKKRPGAILASLSPYPESHPKTNCAGDISSPAAGGRVSFLTKIRKVIHTTPVLRQVSQGFANAWGAGKAYAEFDAKIGYSESGDPVPSQDAYQGFGRSDLAQMAAERYPGTAALVASYRENESRYRAQIDQFTPRSTSRPAPMPIYEDDYSDEEDFGDDYADEEE
jgi:hypothetical protein